MKGTPSSEFGGARWNTSLPTKSNDTIKAGEWVLQISYTL